MTLPSPEDFALGFDSQTEDSYEEAMQISKNMYEGEEYRALAAFTAERILAGDPIGQVLTISLIRCAMAGVLAERNRAKREGA